MWENGGWFVTWHGRWKVTISVQKVFGGNVANTGIQNVWSNKLRIFISLRCRWWYPKMWWKLMPEGIPRFTEQLCRCENEVISASLQIAKCTLRIYNCIITYLLLCFDLGLSPVPPWWSPGAVYPRRHELPNFHAARSRRRATRWFAKRGHLNVVACLRRWTMFDPFFGMLEVPIWISQFLLLVFERWITGYDNFNMFQPTFFPTFFPECPVSVNVSGENKGSMTTWQSLGLNLRKLHGWCAKSWCIHWRKKTCGPGALRIRRSIKLAGIGQELLLFGVLLGLEKKFLQTGRVEGKPNKPYPCVSKGLRKTLWIDCWGFLGYNYCCCSRYCCCRWKVWRFNCSIVKSCWSNRLSKTFSGLHYLDTLRCIDLQPLGPHGNLGMGVGAGFGFYFSLQWHGTMVMVKFSSQRYPKTLWYWGS